jgi:pyruvate dehydrogenase E1 component
MAEQIEALEHEADAPALAVLARYLTDGFLHPAVRERGGASWYGRKFHGKPTASGEPYDMYAMTAAHKTMPIPSYARVRNPANGREVVVRINDRGPFVAGRVIDLSYTAALKLGVLAGVAPVEVERLTLADIRSGACTAKGNSPLAARILTTSPDVTVSTNLGAFVNQRGLFRRQELPDVFRDAKIPSPQKWQGNPAGQHVELGIAEHNLFLMLAAAGLAAPLFGERLIPIGTVYDPFIARGLDALNYACYQDARFLLVATPSGLTLGGEGGAHQSINPPLIAMGQPGLTHYEPAHADELALLLEHAFHHMQAEDGGSIYLRLSTRTLEQPKRADDSWKQGTIDGAYWHIPPTAAQPVALVAMGAILPEVLEAHAQLAEDMPGLGLLQVTSPAKLHRDWSQARAARWKKGSSQTAPIEALLAQLPTNVGLVTVCDAAPASLSWLGGVLGHRVSPLGTDRFGQTGTLPDLYAEYRIGPDAIVEAAAELVSN